MDNEIVARAQLGDERAFEALTVAGHPRLFRVAYGVLRDPTLAEDATQQAFIDIWHNLRRLGDPSRFETWSYRLLIDACYDETTRRTDSASDAEPSEIAETRIPDPFGTVIDRDQIGRGFAQLSLEHRAVIVLRYLLDLSPEDTAEALGVSQGSVASRIERALEALSAILDADAPPATTSLQGVGAR